MEEDKGWANDVLAESVLGDRAEGVLADSVSAGWFGWRLKCVRGTGELGG